MIELLKLPDERLRAKAKPVKKIDDHVKEIAQELLDRLQIKESVGLAAPQYGEMIRLIVIRYRGVEAVFVNPEIVKMSGHHLVQEGCLSIPHKQFEVRRPKTVKVRGLNLDGQIRSLRGHDELAAIICHEVDHLDGILIDQRGSQIN